MAPSATTTSVQVAVRIRPTTSQDASIPSRFQRAVVTSPSPTSISIDLSGAGAASSANGGTPVSAASSSAAKKQAFTFDQVHGPNTTQHTLFQSTTEPLINKFMEGFNCTVLAYGQTSSGKTYSMTGVDLDADPSDPNTGMGIIPRAVATIFQRVRQMKADRGATWSCTIKGSFIELYNEDLLDLLSSDDGKREVQIREDKDGHIIWGGLREVTVVNAQEVMGLIHQGSSLRRTNETNMNAQSSRSHAIFSLTLVQRKFTGSGQPPRSSSPLPPTGRSPSRIGRPSSTFGGGANRVSSPTFGRSPTPSFASAMGRGGLRPSSALGSHGSDGRSANLDEDAGDWVTVVSKFHFVDLAGSERLKRTAAAGERAKEGISINSGLLALGNVISALGDPSRAKTHTATHVPYRDSKLTRLLQDSLGGNAHTLMIACVSPAEWNVGETVNTLKYANRARNIKNRASIAEKEEGWDDLEWLRGMVTRLRKEMKTIKEGGGFAVAPGSPLRQADDAPSEGASKRVLQQMVDLQTNYEDLREKFVQRTEELTRLRRELGEKHRESSGAMSGTSKYEEIVGPVIEEYEKTISAMEAELSLNRAALRHTNDLVEEKEEELAALTERHSATEAYVEELRSRVSKVSERESSTEAYIRDLEEKVKTYGDSQISSSESVSDLRREIARFKDAESHSTQYIADLEARLARSDESVLSLREEVSKWETDAQRRREEVEFLQSRLDSLQNDGQSWKSDLELRERKVMELQRKLEDWEMQKQEASDSRARLGDVMEEVAEARKSLQIDTAKAQFAVTNASLSTEVSPVHENTLVEDQLVALQQTHTATLADLASVTSKYRDALREISDLAGQISELKLQGPRPDDTLPEESTERSASSPSSPRRRISRKASEGQINIHGRRPFFREAASMESLHSRSPSQSQSLSQELSSARSRNHSISSTNGLNSAHLPPSRKGSVSSLGGLLSPVSPLARPDTLAVSPTERSPASLEKEIMRLQEVLKERENEISTLEATLRQKEEKPRVPRIAVREHPESSDEIDGVDKGDLSPKTFGRFKALRRSLQIGPSGGLVDLADDEEALSKLNELMLSMALKETEHREIVDNLNEELAQIRKQHEELTALSRDQTLNMSNELAALQRDRESASLEAIRLRERATELQDSLKVVLEEHASEAERLRAEHEETLRLKEAAVNAMLRDLRENHTASQDTLRDDLAQAVVALSRAQDDHEAALGKLKAKHEEESYRRTLEVQEMLSHLRKEHESAMATAISDHADALATERSEATAALQGRDKEHASTTERIKTEHDGALRDHTSAANSVLLRTREEYAAAAKLAESEQQQLIQRHAEAMDALRSENNQAVETQSAEFTLTIDRLKEEHAAELRRAEITREGSLSESQSAQIEVIGKLEAEHALAMEKKEADFKQDLQRFKTDHERALAIKEEAHRVALERLKASHSEVLSSFQEQRDREAEHTALQLSQAQKKHSETLASREAAFKAELTQLQDQHSALLLQAAESHARNLTERESAHKAAFRAFETAHTDEIADIRKTFDEQFEESRKNALQLAAEHSATLESLKQEHNSTMGDLIHKHEEEQSKLEAEHTASLTASQSKLDAALTCAKDEHSIALTKMQETHAAHLKQREADHLISISSLEQKLAELQQSHTQALLQLKTDHQNTILEIQSNGIAAQEQSHQDLAAARSQSEQLLATEQQSRADALANLEEVHAKERDTLRKDHDLLVDKIEALQAAVGNHDDSRVTLEGALREKDSVIATLHEEVNASNSDRELFASEIEKLKAELERSLVEQAQLAKQVAQRSELEQEMEKHHATLQETQQALQRSKDDVDALQVERQRQDALVRQLQLQLATTSSTPRPLADRTVSISRVNGVSIPPQTPPPTGPPPPPPPPAKQAPTDLPKSVSSLSSTTRTSSSSHDSATLESPSTSIAPSLLPTTNGHAESDLKVLERLEDQARQIEEREVMIKTLNKQLSHCESDLQAHMDLVATLETSLGDSEKNLRKTRTQATELARERDALNGQIQQLRRELQETTSELNTARRSLADEKQSLEQRLDEERKAKERARAQLDSRMDELQKRKSKFACL